MVITASDAETPLAPELAALEAEYVALDEEAQALADGLSPAQLTWRPEARRWSITDCLDHLNATGYKLLPRLDEAIAEARSRSLERRAPYRPRLLARLVLRALEPPYRLRFRVPAAFAPAPQAEPRQVIREFVELQGELVKRLWEADGLDLGAVKIASPARRLLSAPLGDWLLFLAAHERRHLHQARAVRAHPDLPGPRPAAADAER